MFALDVLGLQSRMRARRAEVDASGTHTVSCMGMLSMLVYCGLEAQGVVGRAQNDNSIPFAEVLKTLAWPSLLEGQCVDLSRIELTSVVVQAAVSSIVDDGPAVVEVASVVSCPAVRSQTVHLTKHFVVSKLRRCQDSKVCASAASWSISGLEGHHPQIDHHHLQP
jgi:hypothetical protein